MKTLHQSCIYCGKTFAIQAEEDFALYEAKKKLNEVAYHHCEKVEKLPNGMIRIIRPNLATPLKEEPK